MKIKAILDDAKKQPSKIHLEDYREIIEVLRDKGYTWREVATFLNDRDVQVDHTTIYKMMRK
jgi:transposase